MVSLDEAVRRKDVFGRMTSAFRPGRQAGRGRDTKGQGTAVKKWLIRGDIKYIITSGGKIPNRQALKVQPQL